MRASNGLSSISCRLVGLFLILGSGDAIMRNGSVILLKECDWNTYDSAHVLYETEVKSKINCAAICFQHGIVCLGFQLLTTISVIKCRLFLTISLENCASQITSSTSFFYKRTDVAMLVTTQPVTTLAPNPCQNGGTYTVNTCSCVFGCSGQYCQTCINECSEASGVSGTGVAWIKPTGFDVPKQVWCNFDHGVTYIQIRKYGTVSFNRSYAEYENGFGDANGDYWLGNKYTSILSLTRTFTSGFTLMKSSGSVMVYYSDWVVLDSNSNYALQYSSSSSSLYPLARNQPFQAYDTGSACAITLGSGWWFGTCSSGSMNGPYPVDFGAFSGATTTRIGIY